MLPILIPKTYGQDQYEYRDSKPCLGYWIAKIGLGNHGFI